MPNPEQSVPSPDEIVSGVVTDAIINAPKLSELPAHATESNATNPTRESSVQPPLTDAQVAQLEAQRGQPVTDEQRKFMDMARARGIHHTNV